MTALLGSVTYPVGFGGFNSGSRRDYSRPHYSPSRTGYQSDIPRNYYIPKEDYHIKVRPFYLRKLIGLLTKVILRQLLVRLVGLQTQNVVKLVEILQGSLTGLIAGIRHPVSYDQLVGQLDSVHGISNERDDALMKISNCRKGQEESMSMFGETVRQIIGRDYPIFSPTDKDIFSWVTIQG